MPEEKYNGTPNSCHNFGLVCKRCYRKGNDCDGDDTEVLDEELEELDVRGDK